MITFDLRCDNGHIFEGWFDNRESFEDQQKKSMIACPICDNTSVQRIPSTFAVKSFQPNKSIEDIKVDVEKIYKRLVDYVENNFDDVGCNFAKEALKIHYGVTESRNIKGTSTEAEEKILKDEGIDFIKFPVPKKTETNDVDC